MSLGRNSFAPWVRQGLANAISSPAAGSLRATTRVELKIAGTGGNTAISGVVAKDIEIYGPADALGIDSSQIVRTEPRNWVTDFEPNYIPFIEFYQEDIPWRYSPAVPVGAQLTPWLALIVLTEDEHVFRLAGDRPIDYVEIANPDDSLPDPSEAWAWAHVHTNETITGDAVESEVESATTAALDDLVERNADLAYSRIVAARQLKPKTRYHAYLVPQFESGRLAGLGLNVADAPSALHFAWRHTYPAGTKPEPQNIPVYHHWQFDTSETGDFEYLVRLLKPRVADSRIGRRPIDVTDPSSNISGIAGPFGQGVLRLGGALQVPFDTLSQDEKDVVTAFEQWSNPYPTGFQSELAGFLNLGDAYTTQTAEQANNAAPIVVPSDEVDDPLVLPPIYGQWHARTHRLLNNADGTVVSNRDNWVHEANLDPRHRTTAAFGTKVIQRNQEKFMTAAWEQVGDVIAANRRLRFGQLGLATNLIWHQVHLAAIAAQAPGRMVQSFYPIMRRLPTGQLNARAKVANSVVPPVALSSVFRRASRPRGPFDKRLISVPPAGGDAVRDIPATDIVSRIADGEIVAAPPKITPASVPTPADLPPGAAQSALPAARFGWVMLLLLILFMILLFVFGLWPLAIVVGLGALYIARSIMRTAAQPVGLSSAPPTADAVERMPVSPNFKLTDPFAPDLPPAPTIRPIGFGNDSAELARYKEALTPLFAEDRATPSIAPVRPAEPIDIKEFANALLAASDPRKILPSKFEAIIAIPERFKEEQRETFAPVMAYPTIDIPMYKYLIELSDEHFLPNLQFVAQNSISVLETNQPFIESYMLGLNHEFCREMLWREYPTDQRATSFRQFWDVSTYLDTTGKDASALREELRDIPPIHIWPRASKLGDHDHRDQGGTAENELVLVIRGDLLKRYPTAVIYAQKAKWQTKSNGQIDNTLERELVELSVAQEANPPENLLKTPLYEARVAPDIFFFGFDLTAIEARGESGDDAGDDPGWFFVIKERPGEPRFGFDVEQGTPNKAVWSDLAWSDIGTDSSTGYVRARQSQLIIEPPSSDERHDQWLEDRDVSWTTGTNSAELAYILYQLPVMVGVHAADMLPRSTS